MATRHAWGKENMFLPGRRENAEEAAEHCKRRGTIRGCSRVPPAGEHRTNAAPAVRRRVDGAVSPAWSAIGRLTQMAANRAQAPAHWTWIDGTLAVRYETADGIAVNPTGTNALWTIPAVVHRLHQLVLEFLYAAAHRKVRDNEHVGHGDNDDGGTPSVGTSPLSSIVFTSSCTVDSNSYTPQLIAKYATTNISGMASYRYLLRMRLLPPRRRSSSRT